MTNFCPPIFDNLRKSTCRILALAAILRRFPATNEHLFLRCIDTLRQDLAELAGVTGCLCDPRLVATSQQLDEYILAIQRIRLRDYFDQTESGLQTAAKAAI